jgi:hypothetical protein
MTRVHDVSGEHNTETFLVNLGLPNDVAFSNVRVTSGKIHDAQVLIGMDIITHGDVSLTNLNGRTVFSFRIPSIAEVDFVDEAEKLATLAAKQQQRAGRKRQKKRQRRRPWN